MLTNQKIKFILEEAKSISGIDFVIYDAKGNQLTETFDVDNNTLKDKVLSFSVSEANSQMIEDYNFIKVVVKETLEYILVVYSKSSESYIVGRLISAQLKNICEAYYKQFNKADFLNNVITGGILPTDIHNKAKQLRIEYLCKCVLFVIEARESSLSLLKETLINLMNNKDFLTEIQGKYLVLVKAISDNEKLDVIEFANEVVDTLQAEVMTRVRLGISNSFLNLRELPEAHKEANIALKVGQIFHENRDVFVYDRLGVGRLINQLPLDLCEIFVKEILGENISKIYDEENSNIIQVLFKNNLNISETARQLFMHRNTLVYRLERIERDTGLDVRRFDDAILYYVVKMVLKHIKNIKNS